MNNNVAYLDLIHKNKYIIHKKGFILNLSTGYIYTSKLKDNYLSIVTKKYKLDKLIFSTFNGIKYSHKLYFHHLDNNLLNNNLENLELITRKKYIELNQNKTINYNVLDFIILYKKYTLDYKLLDIYTNHRFIKEYNYIEKEDFIFNLLNNEILINKNYIWEASIITIDKTKLFDYINIENTQYKIALDHSHILDQNNNIIKYKINNKNEQYIKINDNFGNEKNIKLSKDNINLLNFNNITLLDNNLDTYFDIDEFLKDYLSIDNNFNLNSNQLLIEC